MVLKESYINYYYTWMKLYDYKGESYNANCNNCELFYTNISEFNLYCSFLFGVLNKVYKKIGSVNRDRYNQRYLAFLGERLLSVYLLTNNKKYLEVEMKQIPQGFYDYIRIFLKRISRILRINKNSRIYIFFSKKIKHNSSFNK